MPADQTSGRIEARFAALKKEGRAGLVCFITSGDPDPDASLSLLNALPAAGADIIEFGMPFSDPMADGPTIQASSQRALRAGQTLRKTLAQVRAFRESNSDTPLILMGYYNPIYVYGVEAFIKDALAAGVDGLIIVDLPPEEDGELCIPATRAGLRFIRLATPTTSDARLPAVLNHASGFLYYVSMTGITGSADANQKAVADALGRLRPQTDLPIAVGFGIKTPDQAAAIAGIADGVVVGSAIVEKIGQMQGSDAGLSQAQANVLDFVGELAAAVRQVRR